MDMPTDAAEPDVSETTPMRNSLADSVADGTDPESAKDQQDGCYDPYFYTKRDEFTSEVFKIEVEGLPRLVGYSQIKKLLTKKMNLKPHKIKVVGQKPPMVYVTFRCEEDREHALKTICNFEWKGQKLRAKIAYPMADPLVMKRTAELSNEADNAKKAKMEKLSGLSIPVMVKSAITPLWHLSYEDQLKDKQEDMRKFLAKLSHEIKYVNPVLAKKQFLPKEEGGLCCPLLPIRPSPLTSGYRNKCEFNVGLHPETAQPTVGFRISSYKEGSKCVAEASHCINIPDVMYKAAEVFQDYIRQSSLSVFNPENHEGYWRQLTVRTGRSGQLLLIVVIHPQSLSEEEISEEKRKLQELFSKADLKVSSLFFQRYIKREKEDPPLEHVSGTTFIEEELLGLTFRISPDAFFQVNTPGAELMYQTVGEFSSLTKQSTVLDLCCGTGAIGLSLAKDVLKVIGVEMSSSAVQDARHNVDLNGIKNADFICGKVEDMIFNVFNKVTDDQDVVAVLDPPRAGLANRVIKAIRGMPRLKRLVYLSCSPQLALTNMIDLCRPSSNNYRGTAFRPVKAVAVDMFPHTNHCELLLLFERQ